MFSLRGALAGLSSLFPGGRRRPPQPASHPAPDAEAKRRRGYEDKMRRPADYEDKARTPGYLVHEERP